MDRRRFLAALFTFGIVGFVGYEAHQQDDDGSGGLLPDVGLPKVDTGNLPIIGNGGNNATRKEFGFGSGPFSGVEWDGANGLVVKFGSVDSTERFGIRHESGDERLDDLDQWDVSAGTSQQTVSLAELVRQRREYNDSLGPDAKGDIETRHFKLIAYGEADFGGQRDVIASVDISVPDKYWPITSTTTTTNTGDGVPTL
jgi:hypothetical protein